MKKGLKIFFGIIILSYIALYFSYQNGYYEIKNNERKILTDEMILEYEKDLANGIDVTNKEYTVIREDYSNKYTQNLLKISKKIENGIDGIIKYFFRKVSDTINE